MWFLNFFLLRLVCFCVSFFVGSCFEQISKCFKKKWPLLIVSEISKGQIIESQNCRALHCRVYYPSHSPSINFINLVFYLFIYFLGLFLWGIMVNGCLINYILNWIYNDGHGYLMLSTLFCVNCIGFSCQG